MIKKILIADDNDDLRTLICHELLMKGYSVFMASDGQQAVDQCLKEMPDLVLMDISMPGKDGTEAAADLKQNPMTRDIPVIFLTALIQGSETDLGNEAADRVILSKSTPTDELVKAIEKVLSQKKK